MIGFCAVLFFLTTETIQYKALIENTQHTNSMNTQSQYKGAVWISQCKKKTKKESGSINENSNKEDMLP